MLRHAAGCQAHGDVQCARIECVIDELAHHRGGALDHLAGRDLAHQLVGQLVDRLARPGLSTAFIGRIVEVRRGDLFR